MPRKPGPKVDTTEPLARVTLTLDALTRRRLRVLGDGNESAGARVAARVAYDRYQRSDTAARRTHACEVPGCVTCQNPPRGDDDA